MARLFYRRKLDASSEGIILKLTKLEFALVFAMIQTVNAGTLNLADEPLYLGGVVDANIMILLDDSGSMQKEFFPDSLNNQVNYLFPPYDDTYGSGVTKLSQDALPDYDAYPYLRSSDFNSLYFDPEANYSAWVNADGTSMAAPSLTAVKYEVNASPTLNFTQQYSYSDWIDGSGAADTTASSHWPVTFYIYKGTGNNDDVTNFYKIEVKYASGNKWYFYQDGVDKGRNSVDVKGDGSLNLDPDDVVLNFAYWFQYHRSRIHVAKAAIGEALEGLASNTRTGFTTINSATIVNPVRAFTGADRTTITNSVYGRDLVNSDDSPLRNGLETVGDYYSDETDLDGPWAENPGTADTLANFLTCRTSYTVMMSDGYYDNSVVAGITGNVDGDTTNKDSGSAPYADAYAATLADVSYHYWETDLLPNVANKVSDSDDNPADWQHMIVHAVTFGIVDGIATNSIADMEAKILAGENPVWPEPDYTITSDENKLYDMWHAAINARGEFYAASEASEIISSLSGLVNTIEAKGNSSASVALNSGSIYQGSELYQARFSSAAGWWGELFSYDINPDGTVKSTPNFEAGSLIDALVASDDGASRKIALSKKNGGVSFVYDNFDSFDLAQKNAINAILSSYTDPTTSSSVTAANVVDYLRGSDALEGVFRERSHYMGDIIQSSPVYVGPPAFSYPDAWTDWNGDNSEPEDSALYSAYRGSYMNRPAVIYVGANDGMMHAFAASNGEELGAIIPYGVTDTLVDLLAPSYSHKYYVDGTPNIVDAFFDQDVTDSNYSDDDEWRTVMAFGLNAGGQSITAVDVSVPPGYTKSGTTFTKNGSADNLASSILWEFTDEHDADMGYSFSRPQIIRMWDGNWYVAFGNGYNNTAVDGHASTTGRAVLYLARLEDDGSFDGTLGGFIKIDTGEGNATSPNGMSTITPIDYDGDYIVDYIYAGDLYGNIWRFNVADTNSSNWVRSQNRDKLFTAKDASNVAQPITTRIQVMSHPDTIGSFILLFGTGKYLEVGDNSSTGQQTQTFYGIWDVNGNSVPTITRSNLQQQKISAEVTISGDTYRITTANEVDWDNKYGWYMDLCVDTGSGCTNNYGERQVSDSVIRGDRIVFTTILPSSNACSFGGDSWLMELDAATGSRTSYGNFDTDGDGDFDLYSNNDPYDNSDEPVPVSLGGKKSTVGLLPAPGILSDATNQKEFKYMSGSTGQIEVVTENANQQTGTFIGRQSWQEIRMGL